MQTNDRTVLLLSCLPPPLRGVQLWTAAILKKGSLGDYRVDLIDTSKCDGARKPVWLPAFLSEPWRNARIVARLIFVLVRGRPSVIHLNSFVLSCGGLLRDLACLIIARLFRVPAIIHFHSTLQLREESRLWRPIWRLLVKWTVRASWQCFVQNKSSMNLIFDIAPRTRPEKVSVVPNFLTFDPALIDCRSRAPSQRLRAVYVGVLTRVKGYFDLLAIAELHPSIEFALIGPRGADLSSAESAPPNVVYLGEIPNDRVRTELCDSDIFIFPSYLEGFPMAVLEAMAVGLPIVASRAGAIPEMVDECRGGLLSDAGDVAGLSRAMTTLTGDANLRLRMGRWNAEKVRNHYSFEGVASMLSAKYDHEVAGGPC